MIGSIFGILLKMGGSWTKKLVDSVSSIRSFRYQVDAGEGLPQS